MANNRSALRPLLTIFPSILLLGVTVASADQVRRHFTGEVKAVDVEKKAILIQVTPKLDVGAEVDDSTLIRVGGKKAALADIKVGDRVELEYVRNGKVLAKAIRVVSKGETAQ